MPAWLLRKEVIDIAPEENDELITTWLINHRRFTLSAHEKCT